MKEQSKIVLTIYHHLARGTVASYAKVEYTGCPITILILKNEPNFVGFQPQNRDLPKKRTQNEPKRTQFFYSVFCVLYSIS
jgi:hypothetical protein